MGKLFTVKTNYFYDLLKDRKIDTNEFLVLDQIIRHNLAKFGFAKKQLHRDTSLAIKTVSLALDGLEAKGYISRKKGFRLYNKQLVPCFFVQVVDKKILYRKPAAKVAKDPPIDTTDE